MSAKGKSPKGKVRAVKIPAFQYSTRNKSAAAYKDRLRVLKLEFGIKTGIPVSGKLTPQRKSAITRMTRRVTTYLNPANRFRFVETSAPGLRAVKKRGDIAPQAITRRGVFIQIPKSRKKIGVKVKDSGEIEMTGAHWQSSFALYNSVDVVTDPNVIRRDAKKRGATNVFVSIKGFRGKRNYRVEDFMFYFNETLLPDIEESIDNGSGAFKNYFGVEFVNFAWRTGKPRKASKKKGHK